MTKLQVGVSVVSVVCTLALPTWAAETETLDSVEKKLTEAAGRVKAVSCKRKLTFEKTTNNITLKSETASVFDYARTDAEPKFRLEARITTITIADGQETKADATDLVVCDGSFGYVFSDTMGERAASKVTPAAAASGVNEMDIKACFAALRQGGNVKLLPDEKLDGRDVFVIEATQKQPQTCSMQGGCAPYRKVSYYAKDLGLKLKDVCYDKDGKTTYTQTVTDVKLNPEFPPDHFAFKAPAGVEVVDQTKP